MIVVAAPDKMRGTATARELSATVASVVAGRGGTCREVPMSDGGEGFLDVLGGANRTSTVTGPLGDPVEAPWRLSGREAVIEMSQASGLELVGGAEENDPLAASTYGTGELIGEALDAGAKRILVGVGGSATTDGGLGALRALYPTTRLRGIDLVVACDVGLGFVHAAEVFAPQKGASASQVELLRRRLERLVEDYRDQHGVDVDALIGSGAAGGLAGGLAAVGARLESGFEVVADEVELYEAIEGASLVVTGEGFLDAESFDGKVVGGVLSYAADLGVPSLVVTGQSYRDEVDGPLSEVGGDVTVVSLTERFGAERSQADARGCTAEVVASHLDELA